MTINIVRLNQAELLDLNRRIVQRLDFLEQARTQANMLRFAVGERVIFDDHHGQTVHGTLHPPHPQIRDHYHRRRTAVDVGCARLAAQGADTGGPGKSEPRASCQKIIRHCWPVRPVRNEFGQRLNNPAIGVQPQTSPR